MAINAMATIRAGLIRVCGVGCLVNTAETVRGGVQRRAGDTDRLSP